MTSITRSAQRLARWLILLLVLFGSVTWVSASAHDELHVAMAHQLAQEQHHHDDFSSDFDHGDESVTHVHVTDTFQSFGMVQESTADLKPVGSQTQPVLSLVCPPDIFLEGLLRPPQLLL
ncbi:MAG: hypothetical protein RL320_1399 [Pseudomonadota bacterium]|jgi:uncharacterized protein with LGFP repeats